MSMSFIVGGEAWRYCKDRLEGIQWHSETLATPGNPLSFRGRNEITQELQETPDYTGLHPVTHRISRLGPASPR
jgi:hypothetical protein